MKRLFPWVITLLVLIIFVLAAFRLGTHSGVTDAQISEALPGDSILSDPWISIDRAAVLPANASTSWPWIQQLGKDRAGWYAPLGLENLLKEHSAATIQPEFQNLKVGDVVPDWGGGMLRVLAIEPGSYVVYGSIRSAQQTTYAFTWALVLEDSTASSSTFHLRLRLAQPGKTWERYIPAAPLGLIDWATDVVMFRGLQEKLRS